MLPRIRTMTTRKVRKGSVRTIQEDAAEPALVLASNRRFLGGEQGAQDRIVEAYADGPILGEGHRACSGALRLADVLPAGPGPPPAPRAAGAGGVVPHHRRVAPR